ncbi:MAG TPA: protein kinase [bacterium]|nr:protein kinase [bacterium]
MSSGTVLRERAIINDCYILRERVGHDAYCEIWRASALFSATNFLVRFIDANIPVEYCEAERRLIMDAYDVRHAAILDVVEVDRFGTLMFISSEYSALVTLEQALSGGITFSLDHICGFALELSQALDMFNRRGLVYGTVNMQAIFVSLEQGIVTELKLLKPGYLPLVGSASKLDPDAMRCNYGFMAPECKGGALTRADQRADVYSLGILLYRLITGSMPFRGTHAGRALDAPVSVRHISNALIRRGVPPALARIIVTCVRTNPASRYPNMVGLIRELRMFLDDRRLATIKRGAADPLADLENLNSTKSAGGAEQVLRKLDMAEYFGALSEGISMEPDSDSGQRFPTGVSLGETRSGMAGEAEEISEMGDTDIESMSAQDHVDASLSLLGISVSARATGATGRPVATGNAALLSATLDASAAETGPGPVPGAASEGMVSMSSATGHRVLWSHVRIDSEELAASLIEACESARHKRGAFRYIQEPAGEHGMRLLSDLVERMRQSYFVLDMSTGSHGLDEFVPAMQAAIAISLRDVSPGIRRRLKTRFPAVLQSIGTSADPGAAALACARMATRSRPLVLMLRVVAPTDDALGTFFEALAAIAHHERLCVFAFFSGEPPVA